MALLYFILFLFALAFVAVLMIVFKVYMAYRRAKDALFGKKQKGRNAYGGYGRGQNRNEGSKFEDETITFSQSEYRSSRKIFSKDEGEYVDFEEEK